MKSITNWRKATVADLEADGLEDAENIHVVSYDLAGASNGTLIGANKERLVKFFSHHIDNKIPLVMHNGIWYDIPLCERLLDIDLSELMLIDTLMLSWYLNTDRDMHGLGTFHEDYGIPKPKVQNSRWKAPVKEHWNTEEGHKTRVARHIFMMTFRCEEDVKINKALWEDFKDRLSGMYAKAKYYIDKGDVDGRRVSEEEVCYLDQYKNSSSVDEYVDRILTFLMFKADSAALREKTMFEVDTETLQDLTRSLDNAWSTSKAQLEKVMPKVAKYTKKTRPKKPFKKDGSKSATGLRWDELLSQVGEKDENGRVRAEFIDKDTIKVLSTYEEPNANSTQQVKDWLFKFGWEPETFEYIKDKKATQIWADNGFRKSDKPEVRKVPQLSIKGEDGKTLCPSVVRLIERVPEIAHYDKYTTVKHRLDMVKGFQKALTKGKYLKARIGGVTNTLRDQHRELVNLPGVHSPYGKEIRGLLIAGRGKVLLGSDLCSLEDRVKHHFMLPYDPEYVETMMEDDFDPHILMALVAGMITQSEFDNFMAGVVSANAKSARRAGKTTNYACVYGSGAETLSINAGMPIAVAKKLIEAYWKLNWSVKAIAEDQCVFTCDKGKKWLINPINGFCYSLRKDADRFSTLCQGTGSFLFDVWVDKILEGMYNKFKVKRLSANFHDEYVSCFKDTPSNREFMEELTKSSIKEVSSEYFLRRELGCDVQFGYNYSEIH